MPRLLPTFSRRLVVAVISAGLGASFAPAAENRLWADWVEPGFPFYSSTVDARTAGGSSPANNLVPRALVLQLGHDAWAAFDTELLRIAAVWRGGPTSPVSLSTGSYHDAGWKTTEGQEQLPRPGGEVWLANGIYPGWQSGDSVRYDDPRPPAPSPAEVGRGPLTAEQGRFEAIRHSAAGPILVYRVQGTRIDEHLAASAGGTLIRSFRVEPSAHALQLVVGLKPAATASGHTHVAVDGDHARLQPDPNAWVVSVAPHDRPTSFRVVARPSAPDSPTAFAGFPAGADRPAAPRWPETVTTRAQLASGPDAFVVDDINLPVSNPWRRSVRLGDVQFFPDGRAAGVTFDGDVWLIEGLRDDLSHVTWRRFASGLHEPQSLAIRDGEIFVFDRNGIWRLLDTNADGEADVHVLFSNVFTQTAETREFANSMKLAPDGSFVIAKGGQTGTTLGRHNATALRISADGKSLTVLGTGLRQAFLGVHPESGLVTASDQQGHYIPATPLHVLAEEGRYYGFLSKLVPAGQFPAPIADPLVWLPHQVNPSAMLQVWLTGARMGPLNGALIHIGYNRPELFRVLFDKRSPVPQGAVVSLSRDFAFPTMNGAVNPADGQLYVAGFQVWGTTAGRLAGLARVRHTGQPSLLPAEVVAMDQGVLLRFDVELDTTATDPSRYLIERWNYRRTPQYGSPHYKLDGSHGQELMPIGSVHLSPDRKAVFVAVPDMKAGVMQLRAAWTLRTAAGTEFTNNAYLTPYTLSPFRGEDEGFGPISVDLSPRHVPTADKPVAATVAEGRRLYEFVGCMACHTIDGVRSFGPAFKGLAGRSRPLADGTTAVADRAYLRESILTPAAKVVKGFESAMPTYTGVLNDTQIESLILFIESVK